MKKKRILLFLIAVALCCAFPCLSAFAENNFVNADSNEVPAGNPFVYRIDLKALPQELQTAAYTITIGGNQISDVSFDHDLKPSYDAAKDLYSISSDRLSDIETLLVTVHFTALATEGQQITVTTAVTSDQIEALHQDLSVTITAPPAPEEEDGSDEVEDGEDVAVDGGAPDAGDFGSETGEITGTGTYGGSANNYLKALSVKGLELSADFRKTDTSYFLSVDAATNSLTVSAKADDSKATVVVAGNTELKSGMNKVLINVTAENGAVRYYRIYVTKEAD